MYLIIGVLCIAAIIFAAIYFFGDRMGILLPSFMYKQSPIAGQEFLEEPDFQKPEEQEDTQQNPGNKEDGDLDFGKQGDEAVNKTLVGLAETEEEAEKIAELYNIELLTFSTGVAVYKTEEDLNTVIKRGKDNGYPELSVNHSVMMY